MTEIDIKKACKAVDTSPSTRRKVRYGKKLCLHFSLLYKYNVEKNFLSSSESGFQLDIKSIPHFASVLHYYT